MKLIVDIPEVMYDWLVNGFPDEDDFKKCYELVIKGTPLPKNHGRLGDLDALEKEIVNGIKAGNYEEGYDNYAHINNMYDCVDCVRYADTIIEAEGENGKEPDTEPDLEV